MSERLSEALIAELYDDYQRGATLAAIGEPHGRKGWQMRRIFLRRGWPMRDGRGLPADMRTLNGKVCWPFDQPQPTTPIRGEGLAPIDFSEYVRARSRKASPIVQRLYDTHGAFACKPKRTSRGIVWRNTAFWWSKKGYYRPGLASGPRHPLQRIIWEAHHRKTVPRGFEIFFRDRDRHNFEIGNLECISKAELHRRVIALGEFRSLGFEERSAIRGRWATDKSRRLTTLLLTRSHHDPDTTPRTLEEIHARKRA